MKKNIFAFALLCANSVAFIGCQNAEEPTRSISCTPNLIVDYGCGDSYRVGIVSENDWTVAIDQTSWISIDSIDSVTYDKISYAYFTVKEGEMDSAHIVFSTKKDAAILTIKRYKAIDLGLSVKWASCNIEATRPHEYGGFFAWGETIVKKDYNWNSYKHCDGNYDLLTKYCNVKRLGKDSYIDDKLELDSIDDVASIRWQGLWRTPTSQEYRELLDNCNAIWTSNYNNTDVAGTMFTSRDPNYKDTLFFPAAGYCFNDTVHYVNTRGQYWSSSLNEDNADGAWKCILYQNQSQIMYNNRSYGLSVRAVCPK